MITKQLEVVAYRMNTSSYLYQLEKLAWCNSGITDVALLGTNHTIDAESA